MTTFQEYMQVPRREFKVGDIVQLVDNPDLSLKTRVGKTGFLLSDDKLRRAARYLPAKIEYIPSASAIEIKGDYFHPEWLQHV
jgi:hypothetical protein